MFGPHSITMHTELCTVCRACELACHHHHSSLNGGHPTFGTAEASIHIAYDAGTGAVELFIDSNCDGCLRQPVARCVDACLPGALGAAERKNP